MSVIFQKEWRNSYYYYVSNDGDYNDDTEQVNPNRPELCDDELDNNCDGLVDDSECLSHSDDWWEIGSSEDADLLCSEGYESVGYISIYGWEGNLEGQAVDLSCLENITYLERIQDVYP